MEGGGAFLHKRLKPDLEKATAWRDRLLTEVDELQLLRTSIAQMTEKRAMSQLFSKRVEIGVDHFVEAEALDPDFVFVKVGLGFFLQVTLDEAPDVIAELEGALQKLVGVLPSAVCGVLSK